MADILRASEGSPSFLSFYQTVAPLLNLPPPPSCSPLSQLSPTDDVDAAQLQAQLADAIRQVVLEKQAMVDSTRSYQASVQEKIDRHKQTLLRLENEQKDLIEEYANALQKEKEKRNEYKKKLSEEQQRSKDLTNSLVHEKDKCLKVQRNYNTLVQAIRAEWLPNEQQYQHWAEKNKIPLEEVEVETNTETEVQSQMQTADRIEGVGRAAMENTGLDTTADSGLGMGDQRTSQELNQVLQHLVELKDEIALELKEKDMQVVLLRNYIEQSESLLEYGNAINSDDSGNNNSSSNNNNNNTQTDGSNGMDGSDGARAREVDTVGIKADNENIWMEEIDASNVSDVSSPNDDNESQVAQVKFENNTDVILQLGMDLDRLFGLLRNSQPPLTTTTTTTSDRQYHPQILEKSAVTGDDPNISDAAREKQDLLNTIKSLKLDSQVRDQCLEDMSEMLNEKQGLMAQLEAQLQAVQESAASFRKNDMEDIATLDDLRKQLDQVECEHQSEISRLKQDLAALQSERDMLREQIDILRAPGLGDPQSSRSESLQMQLKEAKDQLAMAQQMCQELELQSRTKDSQISAWEDLAAAKDLEATTDSITEVEMLSERINQLYEDIEERDSEIQSNHEKIAQLQEMVRASTNTCEPSLDGQQQQQQLEQQEMSTQDTAIQQDDSNLGLEESTHETTQAEILQEKIDQLYEDLEERELEIQHKDERISQLDEQIKSVKSQQKAVRVPQELDEKEALLVIERLEEKVKELEKIKSSLTVRISNLEASSRTEDKNVQACLAEAQETIKGLESSSRNTAAENNTLKENIDQLINELNERKKELIEKDEKILVLNQEIMKLKQDVTDLPQESDEKADMIEKLEEKVSELEQIKLSLEAQVQNLEASAKTKDEDAEASRIEIQQAMKDLESDFTEQLSKNLADMVDLGKERFVLIEREKALVQDLEEKEKIIDHLKAELKQKDDELHSLLVAKSEINNDLNITKEREIELQQSLEEHKSNLENTVLRIKQLEELVSEKEEHLNVIMKEKQNLEQILSSPNVILKDEAEEMIKSADKAQELQIKVDEQSNLIKEKTEAVDELQKKLTETQGLYDDAVKEKDNLQNMLHEQNYKLKQDVADLNKTLQSKDLEQSKEKDNILNILHEQEATLKREIADLNEILQRKDLEHFNLMREKTELVDKLKNFAEKQRLYDDTMKEKDNILNISHEQAAKLKQEIADLNETLQRKDSEHSNLMREKTELVDQLHKNLTEAQNLCDNAVKKKDNIQNMLHEQEAKLKQEITKLNEALQKKDSENGLLERTLNEQQQRIGLLQSRVVELENKGSDEKSLLERSSIEKTSLGEQSTQELDALRKELYLKKEELLEKQSAIEKHVYEAKKARDDLEDCKVIITQKEETLRIKEKDNLSLEEEIDTLRLSLSTRENESRDLHDRVAELQADIIQSSGTWRDRLAEKGEELNKKEQDLVILKEELESLRLALSEKEKECANFRNQIAELRSQRLDRSGNLTGETEDSEAAGLAVHECSPKSSVANSETNDDWQLLTRKVDELMLLDDSLVQEQRLADFSELESLKMQMDEKVKEVDDLKKQIKVFEVLSSEKELVIKKLEETVSLKDSIGQEKQQQHEVALLRIEDLLHDIESLKRDISEKNSVIGELSTEKNKLTEDCSHINSQLQDTLDGFVRIMRIAGCDLKNCDPAADQNTNFSKELVDDTILNVSSAVENFKVAVETKQKELITAKHAMDALSVEVKSLQEQTLGLNNLVDSLRDENDQFRCSLGKATIVARKALKIIDYDEEILTSVVQTMDEPAFEIKRNIFENPVPLVLSEEASPVPDDLEHEIMTLEDIVKEKLQKIRAKNKEQKLLAALSDMKSSLNSRDDNIQKLNEYINQLNGQLSESKMIIMENEKTRDDLELMENKVEELQRQREAGKTELENLQKEFFELQKKCNAHEEDVIPLLESELTKARLDLNQSDHRIKDLEESLVEENEKYRKLSSNYETLENSFSEIETSLESLQVKLSLSENELKNRESKVIRLETNLEKISEEKVFLIERLDVSEKAHEKYKSLFKECEAENKDIKMKYSIQETRLTEATNRLLHYEMKLDLVDNECNSLRSKCETLEKSCEEMKSTEEKTIMAMEGTKNELNQMIALLHKSVNELETRNKSLEEELSSKKDFIADLEERIMSVESQVGNLEMSEHRLSHDLKEKQNECASIRDQLQRTRESLEDTIAELKSQLETIEREKETMQVTNEKVLIEKESLGKQCLSKVRELETALATISRQEKLLKDNQNAYQKQYEEVLSLRQQLSEVTLLKHGSQSKLEQALVSLEESKAQMREAEDRIDRLKTDIQDKSKRITQLEGQVSAMVRQEAKIKFLEESLKTRLNREQELQERVRSFTASNANLVSDHRSLQNKIDKAEREKELLETQLKKLRVDLAASVNRQKETSTLLKATVDSKNESDSSLQDTEFKLEELKREYGLLKKRSIRLEQDNKKLEQKFNKAKEKVMQVTLLLEKTIKEKQTLLASQ